MKRILMGVAICLLLPFTAAAQEIAEKTILKLEDQWVEALITGDIKFLDQLYTDDIVYTHTNGTVNTKAEFFEAIKGGRAKYASIDRDDIKVRFHGDTAIVTCRSVIKVNTATVPSRMIHVYVKQNGVWRMAAYQSTRLPE